MPTSPTEALARLEADDVITTNPDYAGVCCGLPRTEGGFCRHRTSHPIYVDVPAVNSATVDVSPT